MKFNVRLVILWVLISELFFGPGKDFFRTFDFSDAFLHIFDSVWDISLYSSFITVILFYACGVYFILYKTYPKRNYGAIAVGIVVVMLLGMGLRYMIEQHLFKWIFDSTNYKGSFSIQYYILDNFYYATVNMFVGAVVYFVQYSNYNEGISKKMLSNKQSELAFLKSQINPHFLFNSLNNLYSLINSNSEKSLDTVAKLSSMLRYSLYEQDELIALSKELQYIDDYIELEQLRNTNQLCIEFDKDVGLENLKIPPHILIPFIENALKHGIVNDPENPVKIKLEYNVNMLNYSVENKIAKKEKDHSGGIGIMNLRKRLNLLYPDQHEIIFDSDGFHYRSFLSLNLE